MKKNNLFMSLIVFVVWAFYPQSWSTEACQDLMKNNATILKFSRSVPEPHQTFGNHIQFGFESEYLFTEAEAGPLLKSYRPKAEVEGWDLMTAVEKVQWLKSKFQSRPLFAQPSGLFLPEDDPDADILPKELVVDSTGNLEIIIPPLHSYERWQEIVTRINQRFGPGSMQATVSSLMAEFFQTMSDLAGTELGTTTAIAPYLGYFKLKAEQHILEKLLNGHERFTQNPHQLVARSFAHPWVGPFNAQKERILRKYIVENSKGLYFDKERVAFVKHNDTSFKYFGGTAYRPDLAYPDRLVWEIRDCHKHQKCLEERVKDMITFLEKLPGDYQAFAHIEFHDLRSTYRRLPAEARQLVELLFPSRLKPADRKNYSREEMLQHQVFRNFSWPLKNWKPLLSALDQHGHYTTILRLQKSYVQELLRIASLLKNNKITKDEASYLVQGALVKFAHDSDLHELIIQWEKLHDLSAASAVGFMLQPNFFGRAA